MQRYYNHPNETSAIKQLHQDGQYWIHSGDIGYLTEDGVLHVVDRIKRMIVLSGWNLYPSIIENAILQHEAIDACAVVGVCHDIHGHVPKAFLVLKHGYKAKGQLVVAQITQLCKSILPQHSLPHSYEICDSIPLTSVGKVDYRALEQLAAQEAAT